MPWRNIFTPDSAPGGQTKGEPMKFSDAEIERLDLVRRDVSEQRRIEQRRQIQVLDSLVTALQTGTLPQ